MRADPSFKNVSCPWSIDSCSFAQSTIAQPSSCHWGSSCGFDQRDNGPDEVVHALNKEISCQYIGRVDFKERPWLAFFPWRASRGFSRTASGCGEERKTPQPGALFKPPSKPVHIQAGVLVAVGTPAWSPVLQGSSHLDRSTSITRLPKPRRVGVCSAGPSISVQ